MSKASERLKIALIASKITEFDPVATESSVKVFLERISSWIEVT